MSRSLLHALWSQLVEIELSFLALASRLAPRASSGLEAAGAGARPAAAVADPAPAPEDPTRAPDWLVAYL